MGKVAQCRILKNVEITVYYKENNKENIQSWARYFLRKHETMTRTVKDRLKDQTIFTFCFRNNCPLPKTHHILHWELYVPIVFFRRSIGKREI